MTSVLEGELERIYFAYQVNRWSGVCKFCGAAGGKVISKQLGMAELSRCPERRTVKSHPARPVSMQILFYHYLWFGLMQIEC